MIFHTINLFSARRSVDLRMILLDAQEASNKTMVIMKTLGLKFTDYP